jgi:hypothetical protein
MAVTPPYLEEVVRYTRGAHQKVLAAQAMARFENDQKGNGSVSLSTSVPGGGTLSPSK